MDRSKDINPGIVCLSQPEQVDMADAWYEFAQANHFWIKSRFRAIQSQLKGYAVGKRFLEIGCGHGVVITQFEDAYGTTVDGCDLNMLALNQVKNTKGTIYCLDIYDQPEQLLERYDGVLLLDVIEHIDDHAHFLKTGLRYAKTGGLVIINVPALNTLFSKYDTAAGHKRRYTKKTMRKLLEDCGVEDIKMAYWGFSLLPIAVIRKFILRFVREEKIIATGFKTPGEFSNHVLNALLKTENALLKKPPLGTSLIAIGRVKHA